MLKKDGLVLFSFFIILSGLFLVLCFNMHYVILLLTIEMMSMGILFFFSISFLVFYGIFGFMVFLVISVCLSTAGVSLYVSFSRFLKYDCWFLKFVF